MSVSDIQKAWAFATATQLDAALFAAFAWVAERRPTEFSAQALSNTMWV